MHEQLSDQELRAFYDKRLRQYLERDAMSVQKEIDGETRYIHGILEGYPRHIRQQVHKYFWKNESAMRKIYNKFKKFEDGPYSVFIYGNVAKGKTIFACCLALYMLHCSYLNKMVKNRNVEYGALNNLAVYAECDIIANLQSAIKSENSEYSLSLYDSRPFLVFDDLGATKPTDWGVSQIYTILNRRFSKAIPTICTANKSLSELAEFYQNDRIIHRLYGVQVHATEKGVFKIL